MIVQSPIAEFKWCLSWVRALCFRGPVSAIWIRRPKFTISAWKMTYGPHSWLEVSSNNARRTRHTSASIVDLVSKHEVKVVWYSGIPTFSLDTMLKPSLNLYPPTIRRQIFGYFWFELWRADCFGYESNLMAPMTDFVMVIGAFSVWYDMFYLVRWIVSKEQQ